MVLSKYRSYTERIQSLTLWPCRLFLDIDEVAQCGFFYNPFEGDEANQLRCAFCKCTIAYWNRNTNPWIEHAIGQPFCIHLMACKGMEFIFRAIQNDEMINEETGDGCFSKIYQTGISKNLYAYGIRKITDFKSPSNEKEEYDAVSTYVTYGGLMFTMPIVFNMTEFAARRDTLNSIPELYRKDLKLEQMAEAGFFFITSGCLRCYYCGFTFQDWHKHRDSWLFHISQHPDCMHIILLKGEDYHQLRRQGICSYQQGIQHNPLRVLKRKSSPDNEGGELVHIEHILKSLKLSKLDDAKKKDISKAKGEKRRQRCACCQQRRREKKLRRESIRTPANFLQRFILKGKCDGPHVCYKCGSGDDVYVSMCCCIIMCNACVAGDKCPNCTKMTSVNMN